MTWINNMAVLLGGGLLALLALWGLAWGVTAVRLVRLRLRESPLRRIEHDAVPAAVRAMLDTTRPVMDALGFVYRYSTAQPQSVVTPGDPLLYCDVYQHSECLAFASVTPSATPERDSACNISWATLLRSGQTLATVNGHRHNLLGDPKGWVVHDDYLPDPRQAWERHRQRLAGQEGSIVQDVDDFFLANQQTTGQQMAYQEQRGMLVRRGDLWQMRTVPAMAYAGKLLLGQRRAGKAQGKAKGKTQGASPVASEGGPAQLQADIHAFEQYQAMLLATRATGTRKKLRTLVITAVLFLGVGSLWISWTLLPVLLAVIALHEAGHYLAMKLSGYRNLSVFFVPGLGGAAVGEKATAGPWEKLFVYLAGPMPGILLAMAGLVAQLTGAFHPPGWFHEFLLACLAINYLNLLPVTPLDGGRIVETFVFARLPAARFVFVLLGLAALAAFGLYADDVVLLVVAVFIGLSLPHQWRVMRLDRAITRQPGQALDERGAVERIFTALQRPAFAHWPFSLRAVAARALLPELQGRRAGAAEAVGGMLIYLACLVGPLALVLVALPPLRAIALNLGSLGLMADDVDDSPPRAARPASPPRDLYAEAARVHTLPEAQRLPLLLEAADFAAESDDRARQKTFLDDAWALAQARPPGDYDRARTLMALASADDSEASTTREERRRQVIAELADAGDAPSRLLLAEAHEQLALDKAGPERVALLRSAVALRTQAAPQGDWLLNRSRQTLAQALDAGGAPGEAEALLRGNVQALVPPAPGDRTREALERRTRRVEEQVQLAWFLLDQGRAQEAGAVLDAAVAALPDRLSVRWTYPAQRAREAQLWAALQGTDAKAIRDRWQAYEASRNLMAVGGGRPQLAHELDRFVVAQATADAALQQKARTAVAASLQAGQPYLRARFCEPQPPTGPWHNRQQQARAQAAKAAGVCSGA